MSSKAFQIPRLYAIVDPEQTRNRAPDWILGELIQAGISLLQLRVKSATPREFLDLAREARRLTRAANCLLIINDRVDIALACDADGVHLGQDDLPLKPARQLVGGKLIGISTHDLEQAQLAERDGADYIGFGPMFGTMTKETGYPARGLDMLRRARRTVRLPIVAIGGINEQNVQQVWQAGADSAAIISDIMGAQDVAEKVRRIIALQ